MAIRFPLKTKCLILYVGFGRRENTTILTTPKQNNDKNENKKRKH